MPPPVRPKVLKEAGVFVRPVSRIGEPGVNILDMITGGMVDLVINTPTKGKGHQTDGFRIRRAAVERSIRVLRRWTRPGLC